MWNAAALSLVPTFRRDFGEVREKNGKPKPERKLRNEATQGQSGGDNTYRR
jgi:hypothetical protein